MLFITLDREESAVVCNNVMAMYVSPDYGVPQGLMLGPGSSDVSAVAHPWCCG